MGMGAVRVISRLFHLAIRNTLPGGVLTPASWMQIANSTPTLKNVDDQ